MHPGITAPLAAGEPRPSSPKQPSEPLPPLARVRRAAPGLSVALAALGLAWPSPSPPALRPIPCARALLVDGQLWCDDELPQGPAALCPGAHGPATAHALAPGDALDTAQLCARSFASPGEPGWSRMAPDELAALAQPVDVNEASLAELESLPRVGPKLAQRIAEGRPYADVDALDRVRGIGPATLRLLRDRAVVHGRTRAAGP